MRQTRIIEALLFASDAPLTAADLARVDERLDEDTVAAIVQELRAEYELEERAFQIYELAGGYQLLTRPEYAPLLERFETVPQAARLSVPALEVLAIIAYRQPIGRAEVEEIRGVQSGAVLRTLQDRNLVDVVGRAEGLGRPLLYGTTSRFLEHFGFRSLEDLPRPDELPVVLRERPPEPVAAPGEPGAEAAAAAAEPGSGVSAADARAAAEAETRAAGMGGQVREAAAEALPEGVGSDAQEAEAAPHPRPDTEAERTGPEHEAERTDAADDDGGAEVGAGAAERRVGD